MTNNNSTDWNITTDIYGIVDSLNKLKQKYLPDEDETTLALGVFGYITDTEAKKIQTSTIMAGQLGNEMFPTRATLTKNVLSHAIYNNISDINASPSSMIINIGLKVEDFDNYSKENRFIFDKNCPIFIGDYEFHFDYDIILIRSENANSYVYSAHHDMNIKNRLSNITDPYLKQPFVIKIGNYNYIIFQTLVRQVTIEETIDKIISESIIDNKTYTFNFDNQIADFDVIVNDNGIETILTPLPYGSGSDNIDTPYCWYLFVTDNTIRITFDSKSFIPGLNSDITIRAYTTLGSKGIFNYTKIDDSSDGFYIDFSSDKYGYGNITCYMVASTDSTGGQDRKTKAELQKLIPKAALSRGAITSDTDVSNYFNLLDSETNRLIMQKKVDNQFSRVWYGYFLLKDEENNIIPTNTITIETILNNKTMKLCDDGRYILPAGSIIKYNNETKVGKVIDESEVPELFSSEYFGSEYYYMTIYNLILDVDPLYSAFFMSVSNKNSFFTFNWVNESCDLQFIATKCNFERNLLTDQQIYKFSFSIAQSISKDYNMYLEETVQEFTANEAIINKKIITNNMKCIIVLYNDNIPYRWKEATITGFDQSRFKSDWIVEFETDNDLDSNNRIKINNLNVAGFSDSINYGYFGSNTKAVVYILGKFGSENGRYNLDSIAPGFEGYTVTNVYNVNDGIDFYENFTNVLDSKVNIDTENSNRYTVSGVPVVGLHYMTSNRHSVYLVDAINERKAYIDYCLKLLENSMNIDFKFFNTYGPSNTYFIDEDRTQSIGHIDIDIRFRISLKNTSDAYTKDKIISEVKEYIEDLKETGDWHAPNMITYLMNTFDSNVYFIEFVGYNNFGAGDQHIIKINNDDPTIVPEFINIRNRYNIEGSLEPCIDIEIS